MCILREKNKQTNRSCEKEKIGREEFEALFEGREIITDVDVEI